MRRALIGREVDLHRHLAAYVKSGHRNRFSAALGQRSLIGQQPIGGGADTSESGLPSPNLPWISRCPWTPYIIHTLSIHRPYRAHTRAHTSSMLCLCMESVLRMSSLPQPPPAVLKNSNSSPLISLSPFSSSFFLSLFFLLFRLEEHSNTLPSPTTR